MTADGGVGGLLAPIDACGPVAEALTGTAWVRALVEVEAALARIAGRPEQAAAILAADVPVSALAAGTATTTSPLVGLVRELRAQAGPEVHAGATSQDVVDTATAVVLRRALVPLLADAAAAADAAARLALAHRDTPVMGRTLLQHALPTTFGLRAARWMAAIDDARRWLDAVARDDLVVQLGGPAGHADPAGAVALAADLELGDPGLAWHSVRLRPARIASALAGLCGVLGKIARDVTLLAQNEIAEVAEGDPARGGSSSIGHKDNPVAATAVLICTRRVPGLLTTVFAAMEQELERGAAGWQVEWATTTELLRLTGAATAWARDLLEHLRVDAARMAAGAGAEPDLGAAPALVDRALAAHAAAALSRG